MTSTRFHRRGFTLIELLVVIAIIAILAAILFPVFAKARENARKSTCQSNLKQIGLAAAQYRQDYDERNPDWVMLDPGGYTHPVNGYACTGHLMLDVFQPYIKSWDCLKCPSTSRGPVNVASTNCMTPTNWTGVTWSYGPIVSLFTNKGRWNKRTDSEFEDPSDTLFFACLPNATGQYQSTDGGSTTGCSGLGFWGCADNTAFPANPADAAPRQSRVHADGGNYLFYDGHVKWLKTTQARQHTYQLD